MPDFIVNIGIGIAAGIVIDHWGIGAVVSWVKSKLATPTKPVTPAK